MLPHLHRNRCPISSEYAGKATTAIHIATYLQVLAPTLLLDGDETRNATAWRDNGKANPGDKNDSGKLPFKIADLNSAAMLAAKYTHVVIDTGQRPTDNRVGSGRTSG